MNILILLSSLLLSTNTGVQNPKIDSLEAKLRTVTTPEKQIDLLVNLSAQFQNISFKKSLDYGNRALILAKKNGDSISLASAYTNVGIAYDLYGNYSKATGYYYKSLKISEAIGDSAGLSNNYNNLANIFAVKDNNKKAEDYYKKSLQIARQMNDTSAIGRAISNLGSHYDYMGQHKIALAYMEEGLRLKELVKDHEGITMIANNLGFLYTEKGNWEKAITYHTRALELAKKNSNYLNVAYSMNGLAEAYRLGNQYDKAINYALQNLKILRKLNSKDEIQIAAYLLSQLYAETNDYSKAYQYLTLHGQYKDSVHNAAMDVKIAELQLTYRNEKAEQENQLLKAEHRLKNQQIERNNIIQFCIVALLLMACVAAFVFFRSRQHLHGINQLLMQNSIVLSQQKEELVKQAQLLHTQKEELEKLNTVKDRLFSVIAHDLKGPLVSLKGLLHIAATGAVPEDKFKQLISKLETSQQNALWLLDNLLVWAKTQMRGIAFRPKDLQAHALAHETIHLLQPQAQTKNITLVNKIEESELVTVDPETTKIIFRNLISNAIKFSYAGGTVTLTADRKDNYLQVSVADTGVGIKKEVVDKLFVARNYSSTGTADEKGSGLGLALCKEFVEQNGGTIWVESEPGAGSIFRFTLPVTAPTAAHTPETTELQPVLEPAIC